MENENDTSAEGVREGDQAGGGATGEGKWTPPTDGSWIPKIRMEEAIENERAKTARLEAEVAKLQAAQAPAKVDKAYSRSELTALVVDGKLTQEQADELFARQIEAKARTEAVKAANEAVAQSARTNRVATDFAQYKKLAPEIMQNGSETRNRISEEYRYLVSVGHSESLETELAATRAVLGPLERLERARSGKNGAETHQEIGGDDEVKDRNGKNKRPSDRLDPRKREHYEGMIKKGYYKGWDEVDKELGFAKKHAS